MKQTVWRYGIYSAIVLIVLMGLSLLFAKNLSYDTQEVTGYLSMLLSMIFVFLGIRYYRNEKIMGH